MQRSNTRLHWNYYLALEKDLEAVSRYIEFCSDNFSTYSIELAHLLLSAASEVDTLAKCICESLDPNAQCKNINDYRKIIRHAEETETYSFTLGRGKARPVVAEEHRHRLSALKVYIPRHSLEFTPWASWASDKNPGWWHSYNNVKHQRDRYFHQATLSNASETLAALLALNYAYHRIDITKARPQLRWECRGREVTRHMQPRSAFLRFDTLYYDNPISELGGHIAKVNENVQRLRSHVDDLAVGGR